MTTRERSTLMPKVSEALSLVRDARADVALDKAHSALENLERLAALLLDMENTIGLHTPQTLFGD